MISSELEARRIALEVALRMPGWAGMGQMLASAEVIERWLVRECERPEPRHRIKEVYSEARPWPESSICRILSGTAAGYGFLPGVAGAEGVER